MIVRPLKPRLYLTDIRWGTSLTGQTTGMVALSAVAMQATIRLAVPACQAGLSGNVTVSLQTTAVMPISVTQTVQAGLIAAAPVVVVSPGVTLTGVLTAGSVPGCALLGNAILG
ncbi:MAG: hypothetical protein HQL95_04640 [Magnetococcales bacterium]|nr:hypothetical protein [Magnetococcales bacterium]